MPEGAWSDLPGWAVMSLISAGALVVTFGVVSLLVLFSGTNPLSVMYYFLVDPLTSRTGVLEVLVKATPLLLTGVSVAFAFSAGYWNIGAEGQLYAGAVLATWVGMKMEGLSPWLAIPGVVFMGALGGALWALPPAWLKTRWDVDEVVTTLLLNPVMIFLVGALLNGPWRNPESMWPQSPDIAASAQFPRLLSRARLHFGFLIALGALVLFWWLTRRMSFGLSVRAVGRGREAARFMGINVVGVTFKIALISGAVAGVAGACEVAGLHYHLLETISADYGYTGIVVATLGGLHPVGVGLAGGLIALIEVGAHSVSRVLGVPFYLGKVVQATLLLAILGLLLFRSVLGGKKRSSWI